MLKFTVVGSHRLFQITWENGPILRSSFCICVSVVVVAFFVKGS